MSDMSFERKFGQLADTQLGEKAPSLIDYRIGFQVIDKNEDETRAVGIAAFIVNNLWLYMPIFFINGRLKGFDLLYVKQKDMFVPARDNWISMLKEHGVSKLGNPVSYEKERTQIAMPPDAVTIYSNPATLGRQKQANWNDQQSIIDKETLTKMMTNYDLYKGNLSEDIPCLGKFATEAFINTVVASPEFANAAFTFYEPEALQKLAHDAVSKLPEPLVREEDILVITDMRSKEAQDLDETEKTLLVNNGLYIRDTRTNHSKIYQNELDSGVLQSPTSPGLYDVFLRDGSYKPMVIVFPAVHLEQPQTLKRSPVVAGRPTAFFKRDFQTVGRPLALIDPEKPSTYMKADSREVLVRPAMEITEKQIKGISGGKNATLQNVLPLAEGSYILFVQSASAPASHGVSAIETKILPKKTDIAGTVYVAVASTSGHMMPEPLADGREPGVVTVEFTGKPGRLVRRGQKIFVPEGTRMFSAAAGDDKPNLIFGDVETAYQVMHKVAGLRPLRVQSSGNMASVEGVDRETGFVEKKAALEHLVRDHGIYAGQAMQLLKEAERSTNNVKTVLIKYASPYDIAAYGTSKPPFQGGPAGHYEYAITTRIQTAQGRPHSGPMDAEGRPILPSYAIERAVRAADAGIKEVFDVSVLQSLVDVADLSELKKDFLADMVKGMDKSGRMLFLFYWHNKEFKDRYGRDDMTKLEDTLKQVFLKTGDLILFLKEKTDYTPNLSESLFGALSEDVGVASAEA